jgi:hypothetical protein
VIFASPSPRNTGPVVDAWINRALRLNPFKNLVKQGTEPIMSIPAAWASAGVIGIEDPKIWLIGDTYYCYCACVNASGHLNIYLMTATRSGYPLTWTAVADPLIRYGQHAGIDDALISSPYLVPKGDGTWLLYGHAYNGSSEKLVLWTGQAPTGPWTWYGVIVSGPASYPQGACVADPTMTSDGKFHLLYGCGASTAETAFRGYHQVSDDGLTWSATTAPFITVGSTGAWNAGGVHPVGQFILIQDVLYLPVQGWGTVWSLGVVAITRDFSSVHWVGGVCLSPDGGSGWCRGAVENPGTVYDAATGKLDMFPVAALSGYGHLDYGVFLARS